MSKIIRVRGTRDISGEEIALFREVERKARKVFYQFGYKEIVTPLIELKKLFERSIGEETDIVEKEMFIIKTKSDEQLALRPEGTASVVRAYVESSMYKKEPYSRFFYTGPMFRYERPQKGRLRQFHQIGAELLGVESPYSDAEVVKLAVSIIEECEVTNYRVEINSLGCRRCRLSYSSTLKKFLEKNFDNLCDDCRKRSRRNPLRALDCKNEACRRIYKSAPVLLENLCEECMKHFDGVQENLKVLGVSFVINPLIVRGLDYYTKTAFEVICDELGAQNAVAAGGRYDGLVSELGGGEIPGTGFAMGIERIIEITKLVVTQKREGVSIVPMSDKYLPFAVKLAMKLRRKNIRVVLDYRLGSLKSQLKRADRENVKWAIIIGEEELSSGKLTLRDMERGTQKSVTQDDLESLLTEKNGYC